MPPSTTPSEIRAVAPIPGKPARPGRRRSVRRYAADAVAESERNNPLATKDEWLTVDEVCDELKISRRTFDRWRAKRIGPRCKRLAGSGPLRVRRSWLEAWLAESGSGAA